MHSAWSRSYRAKDVTTCLQGLRMQFMVTWLVAEWLISTCSMSCHVNDCMMGGHMVMTVTGGLQLVPGNACNACILFAQYLQRVDHFVSVANPNYHVLLT